MKATWFLIGGIVCLGALAVWGQLEDNTQLYQDLNSDRYRVRFHAVQELGKRRDRGAVALLIETVRDYREKLGIRAAAVKSLGMIGDPQAFDILDYTMNNPEVDISLRQMIPTALGLMQDPRAVEALVFALSDEEDMRLRYNALRALDKYDHEDIPGALEEFLEDNTDAGLQSLALELLAKRSPEKALQHSLTRFPDLQAPKLQLVYLNQLRKLSDTRFEPLVLDLLAQTESPRVEQSAIATLGILGSTQAIQLILTRLEEHPMAVLAALTQIGDPAPLPVLLRFYQTLGSAREGDHGAEDKKLRRALVRCIATLDSEQGFALYAAIIRSTMPEDVIIQDALNFLGRSENPQAVDVILQSDLLDTDSLDLASAALMALSRLNTPQAQQQIRKTAQAAQNAAIRQFAQDLLINRSN